MKKLVLIAALFASVIPANAVMVISRSANGSYWGCDSNGHVFYGMDNHGIESGMTPSGKPYGGLTTPYSSFYTRNPLEGEGGR